MSFELARAANLFFPLLGSAILLGMCLRFDWFKAFNHPIDFGLRFRNHRLFGENKTFRGPVCMGIGGSLFAVFQKEVLHRSNRLASLEYFDYGAASALLFGLCLGLAASLSELPNSFLKRQLGIEPGKPAPGNQRSLFYFIDQVDVLVGVWLYLSTMMEVTPRKVIASIILVFVTHQLLTAAGYVLRMRKSVS